MLAIIQARTNSKRFPKKVLHLIKGRPLIQHVIERVKKSKRVTDIIVATSKNKSDNNLVSFLKKNKTKHFRGSLANVASRFLQIAKKKNKKYFIRISGDSPLIWPKIINRAIKLHKKNPKYDLITNIFPRSFPHGQSVEIIKTSILENNIKKMNKFELEHVTQFFYRNCLEFLIKNFLSTGKNDSIKLAVDTRRDLKNILKIIK
jgi:spore coat polysaccharide biosynthesis protein SpsF (cytidylyltransferase family)